MTTVENLPLKEPAPISLVCEEDPQEKNFERFVKLWVNDEITYNELMKNYPVHEASILKKVLSFIVEKLP